MYPRLPSEFITNHKICLSQNGNIGVVSNEYHLPSPPHLADGFNHRFVDKVVYRDCPPVDLSQGEYLGVLTREEEEPCIFALGRDLMHP